MKRAFVAIAVALALGTAPVAADAVGTPAPEPVAHAWEQPAATVLADPDTVVAQSGDSGAMTVVYAVQDGDSLRIETEPARSAADAATRIAEIQAQPDVVAVDVDTTRRLTGLPTAARLTSDPNRVDQWALDALQAETVWGSSTGAGVTVAVIDSGASRHPDLAGTFVRGTDFVDGTDGRVDQKDTARTSPASSP